MTRLPRLLLLGLCLAMMGIGWSGRQTTALATSADVLRAKFVPCTGMCMVCPTSGHLAKLDPILHNGSEGDEWHATCSGSDNCDGHQCDESAPSPEPIAEAIANGDDDALGRLISAFPDKVSYSASRVAIQVAGCKGQIIGHFPVAPELAVKLGLH